MRKGNTAMKNVLFILLAAALVLSGCSNIFAPPSMNQAADGNGTLSLSLAKAPARTIMPDFEESTFASYRVQLWDASAKGNRDHLITHNFDSGAFSTSIDLPVGTYHLSVYAYAEAAQEVLAASFEADDVEIDAGGTTDVEVELKPIYSSDIDDESTWGTFAWEINFANPQTELDVKLSTVEVRSLSAADLALTAWTENHGEIYAHNPFTGNEWVGSRAMPAGFYMVKLFLEYDDYDNNPQDGEEHVFELVQILHVYRGLTSSYSVTIEDSFFSEIPEHLVVLVDDDGTEIETLVLEHGAVITAAANYATPAKDAKLGLWRNAFTGEQAYTFDGWQDMADDDWNLTDPVLSSTTLHATWTAPADYVTEVAVDANIIDSAIAYVNVNATPGVYTLVLGNNRTVHASTLADGVDLTIMYQDNFDRTITLADTGAMFTVGFGAKLTLEGGANLVGIGILAEGGNNSALVVVEAGGELVMEDGSSIRNNHNKVRDYKAVGGVFVDNGATFTMNGGELSGNTREYLDTVEPASRPAGLFLMDTADFTMSGTAKLNTIYLHSEDGTTAAQIKATGGAWYIETLHLTGNSVVTDIPGFWDKKQVVDAAANNISLEYAGTTHFGEFIGNAGGRFTLMSKGYVVDAAGILQPANDFVAMPNDTSADDVIARLKLLTEMLDADLWVEGFTTEPYDFANGAEEVELDLDGIRLKDATFSGQVTTINGGSSALTLGGEIKFDYEADKVVKFTGEIRFSNDVRFESLLSVGAVTIDLAEVSTEHGMYELALAAHDAARVFLGKADRETEPTLSAADELAVRVAANATIIGGLNEDSNIIVSWTEFLEMIHGMDGKDLNNIEETSTMANILTAIMRNEYTGGSAVGNVPDGFADGDDSIDGIDDNDSYTVTKVVLTKLAAPYVNGVNAALPGLGVGTITAGDDLADLIDADSYDYVKIINPGDQWELKYFYKLNN